MKTISIIILFVAITLYFGGCSYRHVEAIKAHAPETWRNAGFEIVGYEGYQIGAPDVPGGRVWYVVQRIGHPGVNYNGFISKWGDEYHIYNLKAIDAIAP